MSDDFAAFLMVISGGVLLIFAIFLVIWVGIFLFGGPSAPPPNCVDHKGVKEVQVDGRQYPTLLICNDGFTAKL